MSLLCKSQQIAFLAVIIAGLSMIILNNYTLFADNIISNKKKKSNERLPLQPQFK